MAVPRQSTLSSLRICNLCCPCRCTCAQAPTPGPSTQPRCTARSHSVAQSTAGAPRQHTARTRSAKTPQRRHPRTRTRAIRPARTRPLAGWARPKLCCTSDSARPRSCQRPAPRVAKAGTRRHSSAGRPLLMGTRRSCSARHILWRRWPASTGSAPRPQRSAATPRGRQGRSHCCTALPLPFHSSLLLLDDESGRFSSLNKLQSEGVRWSACAGAFPPQLTCKGDRSTCTRVPLAVARSPEPISDLSS